MFICDRDKPENRTEKPGKKEKCIKQMYARLLSTEMHFLPALKKIILKTNSKKIKAVVTLFLNIPIKTIF